MKFALLCFIVFISNVPLSHATELKGKTIHICDDGSEWPPFTYYQRVNGEKTDNIMGFSVDVITEIFNKHGIKSTIELPPWKRCLLNLEGAKYQMALSASFSEERNRKFIYTKSYYDLERSYFYSKKKYPNGLDINTTEDLQKYKIGGVLGYNYESYGISNDWVAPRVGTYFQLVKMIHAERIDVFVARYEIIAGLSKIDSNILSDKDLGHAPIEGLEERRFHMLISRGYEHGPELKRLIDDGISELEKSGDLQLLLRNYFP